MDIAQLATQIALLAILTAPPLLSRRVEENLELLFLGVALSASLALGTLDWGLLVEALAHPAVTYQPGLGYVPVGIVQAVLAAGLAFYAARRRLARAAAALARPAVLSALILALGLASSAISAVVAAAALAELLAFARLPRECRARAAVCGAFAVGAGAALLPLGEPLSAIATAKLGRGFLYLACLLLDVCIIVVALSAALAYLSLRGAPAAEAGHYEPRLAWVFGRAARVYAFVFSLSILGRAFRPLAEAAAGLGRDALYALGLLSAAVDNATLVAALVGPEMPEGTLRFFMTALITAGALTIPGNVPNIVIASALGLRFGEWARRAAALGAPLLAGLYAYLLAVPESPLARA